MRFGAERPSPIGRYAGAGVCVRSETRRGVAGRIPARSRIIPPMGSLYDRLLAENERWVAAFDRSRLTAPPALGLAVIACMDARITVEDMLGLRSGDAHIIRNAGGLATEDAIRSLIISQHLLGTEEILLMAHTRCGMLSLAETEVRARLARETGVEVDLPLLGFHDLAANLRSQLAVVRSHPWLKPNTPVHGLIYDVETGRLEPVE